MLISKTKWEKYDTKHNKKSALSCNHINEEKVLSQDNTIELKLLPSLLSNPIELQENSSGIKPLIQEKETKTNCSIQRTLKVLKIFRFCPHIQM